MEGFFTPQSVAVVGASRHPNKVGHVIVSNLLTAGFRGKIFPVNPDVKTLLGMTCYPSVLALPEGVEVAVIAVPARLALQVVEECGKKGIKQVIMVTAGFSEVGKKDLERSLLQIVKRYGMKLLGPNCLGVLDSHSHFDTLFLPRSRLTRPQPGGISFVCQSGAVGSATLDLCAKEGMAFAKFISYGNAVDIDEADILEYLGKDEKTTLICLYVEGIKDGKKFMDVARKVAMKKPIIAIKGGVSAAGARATLSHTASLAGVAAMYAAAFTQCNIVRAETLEDLFNFAKILEASPHPRGPRVQIITNGGGYGILATDALEQEGLEIVEPSPSIVDWLKRRVSAEAIIKNPMDLTGSVTTQQYKYALEACMRDKRVDMVMVIALMQTPLISPEIVELIAEAKKRHPRKPLVVVSTGGNYTDMYRRRIEAAGIPTYTYPHNAARALKALYSYYHKRRV